MSRFRAHPEAARGLLHGDGMRKFLLTSAVLLLTSGVAARADAQQRDAWEVSVVPYFLAAAIDGDMTAGPRTVPVFMSFSDAADNLAGAFALESEAGKGWRDGVLCEEV